MKFMPEKIRRPRNEVDIAVRQVESLGYLVAGSYRREKDTIGDLDVVIPPRKNYGEAVEWFSDVFGYDEIRGGSMKSEGISTYRGAPLLINLWRTPRERAIAGMLLYATGPYDLNIAMRARAKSQNKVLNQYGLWSPEFELNEVKWPAEQLDLGYKEFDTYEDLEKDIFHKLGLEYATPQQRENWKDHIKPLRPKATAIAVKSSNGTDVYHVTLVNGKAVDCECKGFTYRNKCRHLKEAEALHASHKG